MKTVLNGLLAALLVIGWISIIEVRASAGEVLGEWIGTGDGDLWASIRRGRDKPEHLVADISVSTVGCGGGVTVYGKLAGSVIFAKSHNPADPDGPICHVVLITLKRDTLQS